MQAESFADGDGDADADADRDRHADAGRHTDRTADRDADIAGITKIISTFRRSNAMISFRPERVLTALLVAASLAGCAGSRSADSVLPGAQNVSSGALLPKTVATGSGTPSSSPSPAGPGVYVQGTGSPRTRPR